MKKIIVIIALALGISAIAAAQPRAIGGRGLYGFEASYQHTLGGENFIEADLGLFSFSVVNAVATYNFMIAKPDWTPRGEWGFYAGPGASVALDFYGAAAVGLVGNVGLEYTFWFPLQLSVDLRPQVGVAFNKNAYEFNTLGLLGFIPSIGVRYRF